MIVYIDVWLRAWNTLLARVYDSTIFNIALSIHARTVTSMEWRLLRYVGAARLHIRSYVRLLLADVRSHNCTITPMKERMTRGRYDDWSAWIYRQMAAKALRIWCGVQATPTVLYGIRG